MPSALIGIPTHGSVQALTVQSLWELAGRPRATEGWTTSLHPLALGPYVSLNLISLMEKFLESTHDALLRIDSDMCWLPRWPDHFFGKATAIWNDWDHGFPLAIGGIYCRRQVDQNHVPCVAAVKPFPEDRKYQLYTAWTWLCTRHGAAVEVSRLGGGWCLYNRAACELAPDAYYVTKGLGEDYGGCDRIRAAGGSVFGVFPYPGDFLHIVDGHAAVGFNDYWRIAYPELCKLRGRDPQSEPDFVEWMNRMRAELHELTEEADWGDHFVEDAADGFSILGPDR